MINFKLSSNKFFEEKEQGYTIFCEEEKVLTNKNVPELEKHFCKPLKKLIENQKFTGKAGTIFLANSNEPIENPIYTIISGLGHIENLPKEDKLERFRNAIGQIINLAKKHKISNLVLNLEDLEQISSIEHLVKESIITTKLTNYHLDEFFSKKDEKEEINITLIIPTILQNKCELNLILGEQIGNAVNRARHLCDLPANFISPKSFAENAERTAASHGLAIKIFNKEDIIKMGMGGIYNVSKGSCEEPKFIIMEYKSKDAQQTIGMVGKGITFDSGGLSIKSTSGPGGMETMKEDMAGAGTILATMEAIGHIKPKVNVIAFMPLAENMPSGTAMRPGDVIKFYNGKTAEVKNTDAEGRLILADALAYATENYKLDLIIDLATLTGACMHALGHFYAGLMSKDHELSQKLIDSGKNSGDLLWSLPFHDAYKPAIKSTIADISNTGNRKYLAGTITAGLFLENFVKDTSWAHIDMAGTASEIPDRSYYRPGATGFGVRLLIEFITNLK